MKNIFIVFILSTISYADTLRVSVVTLKNDLDSQEINITQEGLDRIVHVSKICIISDKDIVRATAILEDGRIDLELNDEAAERVKKITEKMNFGDDKLAIFIDDKLINTLIIKGTLYKHMSIVGLDVKNPALLRQIAEKLSIKNTNSKQNEKSLLQSGIAQKQNHENFTLKLVRPPMDLENEKDLLKFTQNIRIPDLNQAVNNEELRQVFTLIVILNQSIAPEEEMTASINVNCDILKFLRKHSKEIEKILEKNNNDTVKIYLINKIANSYLKDEKQFP